MREIFSENKYLFLGIALVVVALIGFVVWSRGSQNSALTVPQTDIILFYGRECPHCQDVEKFLGDNKVTEKVKYDSVEVWHNAENARLMAQKAENCGLDESRLGVPFLYARGKCFIGAPDVEDFFRQEAGI